MATDATNCKLKEISFEILQKCPNNCIYCSSNSSIHCKPMVSFSVFKDVIEDAIELGLERLCISGGEPFLHPDLLKMISFAKQKNLEVFVYTSGILEDNGRKTSLTEDTINQLKQLKLDKLIFNFQASESNLYDEIMGTTKCFDLVVDSIHKATTAEIYTEAHFVPMKINYQKIDQVVNVLKDLKVNQISFLRLVLQGRALKNKERVQFSDADMKELNDTLDQLRNNEKDLKVRVGIPLSREQEHIQCNAGTGKLIIRYDGAVYPCEAYKYIDCIKNKRVYPDNINTKSLKEIWSNSPFLSILREKIDSFHNQDFSCEVCPAQMLLKEEIK
ncbi:MAG TPA: hypothetical protein DDW50_08665 [Firmicutes bacterium]|jgi:radical SAM protein with 4Fe4S-binding SPASM domain|nr:hypothetical protein [Bacillota bacterium]